MKQLFEITCGFLSKQNFQYQTFEETQILIEQSTNIGTWKCTFVFHPIVPQVAHYGYFPFQIPDRRRPYAMEMLHRCNSGLILGNFEYDFSKHEVRFKSSIDLQGQQISHIFLHSLMKVNLMTMDQYFTPLLGCLIYNMDVEDALRLKGKSPAAIPQNRRIT